MTSKPRQATVSASGTLDCLSLERKTFKRVMGPLSDILMRNIKEYNKFQASNIWGWRKIETYYFDWYTLHQYICFDL